MLEKAVFAKAPEPLLWRVADKSLLANQGFGDGRFQDVLLPPHYYFCLLIEAGLQTKAEGKLMGCCSAVPLQSN